MDTKWLLDNRIIWRATEEAQPILNGNKVSPESILSQGYSHEFFVENLNSRQKNWPTYAPSSTYPPCSTYAPVSALLPFIKILNLQKEKFSEQTSYVVFLGKEVWPTPFILRDVFSSELPLTNFLFINPFSDKNRQKALEILAHSSNVLTVVTSLNKVSFAFTQKIHLFSKQSHAYTFIFRDKRELSQKSAAHSRWLVNPTISKTDFPSWNISLQHSKGTCIQDKEWRMEGLNEEEVSVYLLPELVDRHSTTEATTTRCA